MSKWKDETSYGRGTKNRTPRVFSLGLPHRFKLIVHRLVGLEDRWFITLRWKNVAIVEDLELQERNLEKAKSEAVTAATALIQDWTKSMQQVLDTLDKVGVQ